MFFSSATKVNNNRHHQQTPHGWFESGWRSCAAVQKADVQECAVSECSGSAGVLRPAAVMQLYVGLYGLSVCS